MEKKGPSITVIPTPLSFSDGSQRIKTYDRNGKYTTSEVPALNSSETTETKEKVKTK